MRHLGWSVYRYATGFWWAEASAAAGHLAVHRAGPLRLQTVPGPRCPTPVAGQPQCSVCWERVYPVLYEVRVLLLTHLL